MWHEDVRRWQGTPPIYTIATLLSEHDTGYASECVSVTDKHGLALLVTLHMCTATPNIFCLVTKLAPGNPGVSHTYQAASDNQQSHSRSAAVSVVNLLSFLAHAAAALGYIPQPPWPAWVMPHAACPQWGPQPVGRAHIVNTPFHLQTLHGNKQQLKEYFIARQFRHLVYTAKRISSTAAEHACSSGARRARTVQIWY